MANQTLEKNKINALPSKLELAEEFHRKFLLRASGDDLANAINFYIESIKENPDIPSSYYRLAALMYENKQIGVDSAIEQVKKAVELDPNNPDARLYLGYFLSVKGQKDLAREEFEQASKLGAKNSTRGRFMMALELLDKENKNPVNKIKGLMYALEGSILGLFDRAVIKMFLKTLSYDINYLRYLSKGKILEKFKKDKDAYQVYSDAVDNTKCASFFYEKMAKIAIKKQRPNVALECYKNASKLSNNNPYTLVSAIEFMESAYPENIAELIDYYNMLVVKLPEFSRPYYELGHLYLKKEDYINASNAFRMALNNDKDNPFYLNSLAFTYVQLEQYDTAIELYKKAIDKNPDNEWTSVVVQALAAIYYKINNDTTSATALLEYALSLTKDKAPIYNLFGDIYYDNSDLDLSIKYYTLAIKEGLKDCKIYSRLATAYYEKNSIQSAIEYYNLAIEYDPLYDIAYNNAGVIYLDSLYDIERAKNYFQRATEINPSYMLAHFNLGRSYAMLGKKVEAAIEYQKAIDLNRINTEIEEHTIQEKLYELFET